MRDLTLKFCIFGDSGVGKTTLIERYLTGLFKDDIITTVGSDFYKKSLIIEGKEVLLQIWDFGGKFEFRSEKMNSYLIREAGGAIFMYDVTSYSSLNSLGGWIESLNIGLKENFPIMMVGGKKDLEESRAVRKEIAEQFLMDFGLFKLIECSARTGENVNEIFEKITLEMMKNNTKTIL